jgi:hypothetical protein
MRNVATLTFAALCGCATSPALASGREGEQYVPIVLVIVAFVVIAFAASMIAGVVTGVVKARRSGDSVLKGGAFGVLKGLWYFVIVSAIATAVVSFLGFLWIAYAFVVTWLGLGATDSQ